MALDAVASALRCPVCHGSMRVTGSTLLCDSNHTFDIAREGYVNLLSGGARPTTADTPEMLAARLSFLGAGHYDPLMSAVAQALRLHLDDRALGPVVEMGGGTGAFLGAALEVLPERHGLLFDISKDACRIAARSVPRSGVCVVDVWGDLPVRDGGAAAVLDVFAPRNAPEFARVIHPHGVLLIVTPTAEHFRELVDAMGLITVDPNKENRIAETVDLRFERIDTSVVEAPLALSRQHARDYAMMGPSSTRFTPEDLDRTLQRLSEPFGCTLSARVSAYRLRTA